MTYPLLNTLKSIFIQSEKPSLFYCNLTFGLNYKFSLIKYKLGQQEKVIYWNNVCHFWGTEWCWICTFMYCVLCSLASTVLDAQLLASNHSVELFLLAEEQRYAHETVTQEPDFSSCQPKESDRNLAKDESTQQLLAETETKSQPDAHLPGKVHQTYPDDPAADPPTGFPCDCSNPLQEFGEQSRHSKHIVEAPKMNLKTYVILIIICAVLFFYTVLHKSQSPYFNVFHF